MLLKRFLLATALLLLAALPLRAEEVINAFVSDVTVHTDGSLDVRETITLRAEGNQIRRGILRDFPTRYKTKNGTEVHVGFDVLGVKRDGQDEPYAIESVSNGERIRIGSKDVFLDTGQHTYEILYHTTRQIGFFDTYDELYWNVTGNGWTFPIEQAMAIIRLPEGAQIGNTALYTGNFGASGSAAQVVQKSANRFVAETTGVLSAGEGFTIAVAWQKGIVTPPSAADLQRDWILDNLGFFTLGLTFLAATGYFFWAWLKVGRDPPKGTIIPLFHPPEGMDPASVRYVWKQGYDNKAFAAGVVGLAVKGRAKIANDDGEFKLTKESNYDQQLNAPEAALYGAMPSGSLELKQSNHRLVSGMRSALSSSLDKLYEGKMFLKNFWWFFGGLAMTAIGLLVSGVLIPGGEGIVVIFTGVFSTIWWSVIGAVAWASAKSLVNGHTILVKLKALVGMAFLLPFVLGGIFVPAVTWFAADFSPALKWFMLGAVVLGLCNVLFYWLMKAPTVAGRKVLDQLEGFRMYMATAEEDRLQVLHPPEKTPELFERYLPYAMALDCENEWNDKFAAVLAAAAAAGAATAAHSWYSGPGGFGSRDFSSTLGSSLTSSISSAGTAPGSSSGSGGGGFSGGGGGGGGGSGW